MRPTADLRTYADLLENIWSDEYVQSDHAMTTWGNDHVPVPGAAARQTFDMIIRDNALMTDRLYLGRDHVRLKDIEVPILTILAERDHIVPEAVASPLPDLVGSVDNQVLRLDAGHIGLVVGRTAMRVTLPRIIEFLHARTKTIGGAPWPNSSSCWRRSTSRRFGASWRPSPTVMPRSSRRTSEIPRSPRVGEERWEDPPLGRRRRR